MFERFTVSAREVVTRARDEARGLGHRRIGTEHLLLALLDESAGVAYRVLRDAGLGRERVRAEIERLVGPRSGILSEEDAAALKTIGIDVDAVLARVEATFGPDALRPSPERPRGFLRHLQGDGWFAPRAKKVIELSLREAVRLGHHYIGTEHILLGILREGDGLAARILTDAGLRVEGLRRQVLAALDKAA